METYLYHVFFCGEFLEEPQRGKGGRKTIPRLPTSKPAKTNTTWEEQCKLAEKLQAMGSQLQGLPSRALLPQTSGDTCYRHKISMERHQHGEDVTKTQEKKLKQEEKARGEPDPCRSTSVLRLNRDWPSFTQQLRWTGDRQTHPQRLES